MCKNKRSFGSAKGEFKLKESFNDPLKCNFYDNIMTNDNIMTKLKHITPGRKFSRDEMNDRKLDVK